MMDEIIDEVEAKHSFRGWECVKPMMEGLSEVSPLFRLIMDVYVHDSATDVCGEIWEEENKTEVTTRFVQALARAYEQRVDNAEPKASAFANDLPTHTRQTRKGKHALTTIERNDMGGVSHT
ncbi:uncharacterized protein LTR77_007718 [Saxophila tyrrhenica]|uniref:Uncharacterized protein n=1 Tax=Saxophila tyrrhenica TaxID=1690608 RepID=A0AAV9P4U6_9PEZI|nr:hypothetical protein LTR77_007718 [Saxophila tyrrhenica]